VALRERIKGDSKWHKKRGSDKHISKRFAATSAIFLSFIVGLEIVIMISPFAFFFYAAFTILAALNQSSMTRWLTAFFFLTGSPPNEH